MASLLSHVSVFSVSLYCAQCTERLFKFEEIGKFSPARLYTAVNQPYQIYHEKCSPLIRGAHLVVTCDELGRAAIDQLGCGLAELPHHQFVLRMAIVSYYRSMASSTEQRHRIDLLTDAANKDLAPARAALGEVYRVGLPYVAPNASSAYQHLWAAAGRDCFAKRSLGQLLLSAGDLDLIHLGPQKKEIGANYLREVATQGDPEAQFLFSKCFAEGTGLPKSEAEALFWCRKAAEKGWMEAQLQMGLYGLSRRDPQVTVATAVKYLEQAAQQGSEEAMYHLGIHLTQKNPGTPEEQAKGVSFLKTCVASQCWSFYCYKNKAALELGKFLAQKNDQAAVFYLKQALDAGLLGTEKIADLVAQIPGEEEEALALYEQATEGEDEECSPDCLVRVAVVYIKGIQREANLNKAETLLTRAVEKNFPPAKYTLGKLWQNQNKHLEERERLLLEAADQDHFAAWYELSKIYREGRGDRIPKDIQKGVNYLNRAAENGLQEALYDLACCCQKGAEGIPLDLDRAIDLFSKSYGVTSIFQRGMCLKAKGRYTDAIEQFLQIENTSSLYGEAQYQKGICLMVLSPDSFEILVVAQAFSLADKYLSSEDPKSDEVHHLCALFNPFSLRPKLREVEQFFATKEGEAVDESQKAFYGICLRRCRERLPSRVRSGNGDGDASMSSRASEKRKASPASDETTAEEPRLKQSKGEAGAQRDLEMGDAEPDHDDDDEKEPAPVTSSSSS